MFYIRKYSNGVAIHNDANGCSRLLTEQEVEAVKKEFPQLQQNQRENSVPNKYKHHGQEHIDDLGLNWDSFKWRNHQPDIGRFFNVDPLADSYVYNSPYAFAENRVVSGRELEGLEWAPPLKPGENGGFVVDGDAATKTHTSYSINHVTTVLGFTPVGIAIDVYDLGVAISERDGGAIGLAAVGFLPGGDFVKNGKKLANAVEGASDVKKVSNITENAAKGKDFEKTVTSNLEASGHTNIAEQVTVKPNGTDKKVRLDNLSTQDGQVKLTDAKASSTAPLTGNQKTGYPLLQQNGGTVVGNKGAAQGYPAGTPIPPTKVDIVRPDDLRR